MGEPMGVVPEIIDWQSIGQSIGLSQGAMLLIFFGIAVGVLLIRRLVGMLVGSVFGIEFARANRLWNEEDDRFRFKTRTALGLPVEADVVKRLAGDVRGRNQRAREWSAASGGGRRRRSSFVDRF